MRHKKSTAFVGPPIRKRTLSISDRASGSRDGSYGVVSTRDWIKRTRARTMVSEVPWIAWMMGFRVEGVIWLAMGDFSSVFRGGISSPLTEL
jgi:hypothetical protein